MINRPIAAVALILLLVALISPASGVEVIVDELITDHKDTSNSYIYPAKLGDSDLVTITSFYIQESALCNGLGYVVFEWQPSVGGRWLNGSAMQEGRYDIEYSVDGLSYPGVLYYETPTDLLGRTISSRYTLFLNDWNGTYSGPKTVNLPFSMGYRNMANGRHETNETHNIRPQFSLKNRAVAVSYASWVEWKNHIVIKKDLYGYEIELFRTIEGIPYQSSIQITKNGEIVSRGTNTGEYSIYAYPYGHIDEINVTAPSGRSFVYHLGDGDPSPPGDPGDSTTLTVYIKNSQTGALIANSNIVIDALVNGEYYPVVNRSEPSGIFSINLQPTGGGPPNPDGYRLIVTADGYNNPMPEINFTVDDYKQSIYCLLDPIAGGPADENKTFIDFFVSDMYANPIPGATVKFGKYTLITNSAGYTVFEVPKNDYYTYTVIKSGYNHLTGNAVIGDAPRNTINTYLTPVITPTTPTVPPIDPPQTQPPGGIPDEDDNSDGFMMQAVRGIANLFGVSFGIGKNILGMLLALGIGTATAKHLRGGAQEFGMGMLGGVVLGVLIGLLPIWVLVLLVLIVGLWIGQRYMSGGDS